MPFNAEIKNIKKVGCNIFYDFIKCLKIGTAVSLILGLLGFILSLVICNFNFYKALEAVRSILFIVGSFGIIIGALLILKKESRRKFEYINEWKDKFKIFSYEVVLIFISVFIILYGCIADYIFVII